MIETYHAFRYRLNVLRDVLRLLIHPTSDRAAIVIITVTPYLTYKEMRNMAEYLDAYRTSGL